jgi:hypothetical protein
MNIYTVSDIELFSNYVNDIIKKAEKVKSTHVEPIYDRSEITRINNLIIKWIIEKKRKFYGGYALNILIKEVNEKDKIYSDDDDYDIDFYSPSPLDDFVELCNYLFESGLVNIHGKEAIHDGTFVIFINHREYCNITYVPTQIYNKLPFKQVGDQLLIHPYFMMIDYLRMFTTPLTSYFRLEKSFKRFAILQKNYPLPVNHKPIQPVVVSDDMHRKFIKTIFDFLLNRKSVLVFGKVVYNYIIDLTKPNVAWIKETDVDFFEFVSSNFQKDTIELFYQLKELSTDLRVEEYYPFFQFLGHSCIIYYKNKKLVQIYDHNLLCLPYIEYTVDSKHTIQLASFTLNLNMLMSQIMRHRIDDLKSLVQEKYIMLYHLLYCRNYYLSQAKKTIYDKTIFEDFVVDCIGETVDLFYEKNIKKRKSHKFVYNPENEIERKQIHRKIESMSFPNISGNLIQNEKRLKIIPYLYNTSESNVSSSTYL